MKNMKCSKSTKNFSLKKIVRRPTFEPPKIARRPNFEPSKNCQSNCPKKEVCEQINVEKCQTVNVRICDRLPPEKCQPKPRKIQKRIVLKCTEIAEIPADLLASLNAGVGQ